MNTETPIVHETKILAPKLMVGSRYVACPWKINPLAVSRCSESGVVTSIPVEQHSGPPLLKAHCLLMFRSTRMIATRCRVLLYRLMQIGKGDKRHCIINNYHGNLLLLYVL